MLWVLRLGGAPSGAGRLWPRRRVLGQRAGGPGRNAVGGASGASGGTGLGLRVGPGVGWAGTETPGGEVQTQRHKPLSLKAGRGDPLSLFRFIPNRTEQIRYLCETKYLVSQMPRCSGQDTLRCLCAASRLHQRPGLSPTVLSASACIK